MSRCLSSTVGSAGKGFLSIVCQRQPLTSSGHLNSSPSPYTYGYRGGERVDVESLDQDHKVFDNTNTGYEVDKVRFDSYLGRIAEGSLRPEAVKAMSAAERSRLRQRIVSLQRLSSIARIAGADVWAAASDVVSAMGDSHAPSEGKAPLHSIMGNAGRMLGVYTAWVTNRPRCETEDKCPYTISSGPCRHSEMRYCLRSSAQRGSSNQTPRNMLTDSSDSSAVTIFGVALILRSAAYSVGLEMYPNDANRANHLATVMLGAAYQSIALGACPPVRPLLTLSDAGCIRRKGKAGARSLGDELRRADAAEVRDREWNAAVAQSQASPQLRAWLISLRRVLFSQDDSHVAMESEHLQAVAPLEVANALLASRAAWLSETRGYAVNCAHSSSWEVIKVACKVDVVTHGRQWALVSDVYSSLVAGAVPDTTPEAAIPLRILISQHLESAPVGVRSFFMLVPNSVHVHAYRSMATCAPLDKFVAFTHVASPFTGPLATRNTQSTTASGHPKAQVAIRAKLTPHVVVATASARACRGKSIKGGSYSVRESRTEM